MSTLVWRLFHKRLPTKENLNNRGVLLNSSALCAGVPVALAEGGPNHLYLLKNLVPAGFRWEKLLEEAIILSWRILRARSKGFKYDLSMWRLNPLACIGVNLRSAGFRPVLL
ncbi:hypothetical protein A2U01_0014992, partial [Trifolium medium]|nr:hypothetical protein [Trifolium medium]